MMKNRILFAAILVVVCVGCNDRRVCHDQHINGCEVCVEYDWSMSDPLSKDIEHGLSIINASGNKDHVTTDNNGVTLTLDPDEYRLIAGQKAENITYEEHVISLGALPDGSLKQPTEFSAGEGKIVVFEGDGAKSTILMIRQTRELIVRIVVQYGYDYLYSKDKFAGGLTGVVSSRDIMNGFPPQENVGRTLENTVFGKLNMEFNKIIVSKAGFPVFTSTKRLIGLSSDSGEPVILRLSDNNTNFFSFDATEALKDFHTSQDVDKPYILTLNLDIGYDTDTGNITGKIIDWEVNEDINLIAEEK